MEPDERHEGVARLGDLFVEVSIGEGLDTELVSDQDRPHFFCLVAVVCGK